MTNLKPIHPLENADISLSEHFHYSPIPALLVNNQLEILYYNEEAKALFQQHLLPFISEAELSKQPVKPIKFTRFVIQNVKLFLDWLLANLPEPMALRLFIEKKTTHVKVYQKAFEVEGERFWELTILPNQHEFLLEKSVEFYQMTFNYVSSPIAVFNAAFELVDFNQALMHLLGYSRKSLLGQGYRKAFADDMDALNESWRVHLKDHVLWQGHLMLVDIENRQIYCRISLKKVTRHKEDFYIVSFESLQDELEEKLHFKELSEKDTLTGLFNRKAFFSRFNQLFAEAQRNGDLLAVMYIDLDHFKFLNDTYGHDYGDELLRLFAKRLINRLKGSDLIARLGGDEFVVVLPLNHSLENIKSIAMSLIHTLRQPYSLMDMEFECQASIGIASYPEHALNAEELLQLSDKAMYYAKRKGKNQYQIYDKKLFSKETEVNHKRSAIKAGLESREFGLFYQPQIDSCTGDLIGFEALARWLHADGSVSLPGEFIPLIQHDRLILTLGEHLRNELFISLQGWQQQGFDIPVAINLSAIEMQSIKTFNHLRTLAENFPDLVPLVELEITESTIFELDDDIDKHLNGLQALGYKLVLDDFGTGYSSIYSLKKFKFSKVKIDKSFIDDILNGEPEKLIILNGMISLVESLGLSLICEGVEQQAQLDYLKQNVCCGIQGFIFSKPFAKKQMWHYFQKTLENT